MLPTLYLNIMLNMIQLTTAQNIYLHLNHTNPVSSWALDSWQKFKRWFYSILRAFMQLVVSSLIRDSGGTKSEAVTIKVILSLINKPVSQSSATANDWLTGLLSNRFKLTNCLIQGIPTSKLMLISLLAIEYLRIYLEK